MLLEKLAVKINNKLKDYYKYLVLGLFSLLVISIVRNIERINKTKEEVSEMEKRVEALKEENEKLKEKEASVKSDFYVEKQIRDKLGLAKEGDIVVVLPEKEVLEKLAPDTSEEEDAPTQPNWKKWMEVFGF